MNKKDFKKILGGTVYIDYTCTNGATLKKSDYEDKCDGTSTKLGFSCTDGATLSAIISKGEQPSVEMPPINLNPIP